MASMSKASKKSAMPMMTRSFRCHGESGAGNQVTLRIGGSELGELPNAKVHMRRLNKGDAITIRAGGGGGFGPPHERDAERVAQDVRQGYVSLAAAAESYGVVLDPQTLEVDAAATHQRRRGK